jgi:hypothetical protein
VYRLQVAGSPDSPIGQETKSISIKTAIDPAAVSVSVLSVVRAKIEFSPQSATLSYEDQRGQLPGSSVLLTNYSKKKVTEVAIKGMPRALKVVIKPVVLGSIYRLDIRRSNVATESSEGELSVSIRLEDGEDINPALPWSIRKDTGR